MSEFHILELNVIANVADISVWHGQLLSNRGRGALLCCHFYPLSYHFNKILVMI